MRPFSFLIVGLFDRSRMGWRKLLFLNRGYIRITTRRSVLLNSGLYSEMVKNDGFMRIAALRSCCRLKPFLPVRNLSFDRPSKCAGMQQAASRTVAIPPFRAMVKPKGPGGTFRSNAELQWDRKETLGPTPIQQLPEPKRLLSRVHGDIHQHVLERFLAGAFYLRPDRPHLEACNGSSGGLLDQMRHKLDKLLSLVVG